MQPEIHQVSREGEVLFENLDFSHRRGTSRTEMPSIENREVLVGGDIGYLRRRPDAIPENVAIIDMSSWQKILESCQSYGTRTILPIALNEQQVILQHEQLLRGQLGVEFLLSSWETISILNNKAEFAIRMHELGFSDYMPRTLSQVIPPCIVKRSEDDWGRNSFLILSQDSQNISMRHQFDDQYIIQEYIPGNEEYASHILMARGEIKYIQTFLNVHDKDYYIQGAQDNEIRTEEIEISADTQKLFEEILHQFNYSGVCCVDYKIGSDGQPRIFEINPRLGATLGLNGQKFKELLTVYQYEVRENK